MAGFFLITVPILAYFYWTSLKRNYINKWKAALHFCVLFPLFLSVSMGLSLHNAMAVIEGYLGKKTPFIRTPKFNLTDDKNKKWSANDYLKRSINPLTLIELLFAFYFLGGIGLAIKYQDFGLLPFHIMLFLGFAYVSILSITHSFKTN